MPITRCPGCQADLEVPAVVPGGVVACPYCGAEFPVKGGARRAPSRGRSRGGGRGPEDDYYEEDRGRGRYRKRADPVPIIVIVGFLVLAAVAAVFVLTKKKTEQAEEQSAMAEDIRLADVARLPISRSPDAPARDPTSFPMVFHPGDRVTIQEHIGSVSLTLRPYRQATQTLYSLTWDMVTSEEGSEAILEADENGARHEGRYRLKSYILNGASLAADAQIEASFRTDWLGNLVPGSFQQTSGPPLSPVPQFLGDRGFGTLPPKPVRHMETYGTDTLPNPFAGVVQIDGRTLESLGLNGRREGGWRWTSGTVSVDSDGEYTHTAVIDFQLIAAEHAVGRGTYQGQPAEISKAIRWTSKKCSYNLKRQSLLRVDNLSVELWVRAKTSTGYHDWQGKALYNYQMYKDP